jgi:hypothetical protein
MYIMSDVHIYILNQKHYSSSNLSNINRDLTDL